MYPPVRLPEKPASVSDSSSIGGDSIQSEEEQRINNLRDFVKELDTKLTYPQKRALRVTWRRLSEAPKTSGRGNLHIMEKIFDRLIAQDAKIMSVFYRSAFIKCIEDRRNRCRGKSIATLRDHAHILIDFIDGVLAMMFDEPLTKPVFDPVSVGRIHARLNPLGFDRHIWLKLGECFAEVMFSQDCVRGYPHAASAWSTLAVACTDKMFTNGKIKPTDQPLRHSSTSLNIKISSLSSTPSQSCKSLNFLDDDITGPPNTQRTTVSSDSSIKNCPVSSSTEPRRMFPASQSVMEMPPFQRVPRQLPCKSACGRYAAKKDALKSQDRAKSSSLSNL